MRQFLFISELIKMNDKFYGKRLKVIRHFKGLSLMDLAKTLDLSKNAIKKYEDEDMKPPYPTIIGICEILEVPKDFFSKSKLSFKMVGNKVVCKEINEI